MQLKGVQFFLLLLTMFTIVPAWAAGGDAEPKTTLAEIRALILKHGNERNAARLEQNEKQLIELVKPKGSPGANISLINGLANMMSDEDDYIRYMVARLLLYAGPDASRAIPALQKAYKERACSHSQFTKSSLDSIVVILRKLNAQIPKVYTADGRFACSEFR